MERYNLWKLGRYGWFHVTSHACFGINDCYIEWFYFTNTWKQNCYRIGDYRIIFGNDNPNDFIEILSDIILKTIPICTYEEFEYYKEAKNGKSNKIYVEYISNPIE